MYLYIYIQRRFQRYSAHHERCALVQRKLHTFLDGYCSTVQGFLDWFEVDLGLTEILFIRIDLCVICAFVRCALVQRKLHISD